MARHELPSPLGASAIPGENPLAQLEPLTEPAPITDFLVQFTVSGLMLVHARDAIEANQQATTFLQSISMKTGTPTDSLAEDGGQVKLGETTVVIDDVQALELPQELPNNPDIETP